VSTSKHIDKICCIALAAVLILSTLFLKAESLGVQPASAAPGYESRLFDPGAVHTIDIRIDDWEGFLEECTNEQYTACTVVIDGEAYKNVGLRAKGNTSLTQVAAYGNNRYSFKIEFDHYDSGKNYHGLDKMCLNNIIQDNTYMKDFLTYQLMGAFGVSAPLCSFAAITVNGEEWGLYLAVEGVEEAFLSRNYGKDYGELYKPDSISMGGGHGNGRNFQMEDWKGFPGQAEEAGSQSGSGGNAFPFGNPPERPEGAAFPGGDGDFPVMPEDAENAAPSGDPAAALDERAFPEGRMRQGGPPGMGGIGSSDVSLIYTDDAYESYPNIFDNAKTSPSAQDQDRLIAALKSINENTDIENSVDIDSVIRYFVVHNFVLNFDSYTGQMIHNYYLYEEEGRLSMIPWDYNLAFGGFESSSSATSLVNYPIDTPVSGGSVDSRPMLAWIFADEEYTEQYHRYFSEFINTCLDSASFSEWIDGVKSLIAPYVESDPTKFCTYEEFETGIDTLKEFCLLRAQSIRGQLEGSIASTSEGQSEEENLIDAGGLSVSAMGSMHAGGGMDRKRPSSPEQPEGSSSPSAKETGAAPNASFGEPPEGGKMPAFPGGEPEESGSSVSLRGWITLGGSALFLILGITAALFFRRRTR
jgi:spore coat protein CotH